MRIFEIAGFVTLSGALHVAALSLAPHTGGSGGGDGGTAEVSLQAATPTLAAMVSDWTRPPEVSHAPSLAQPVAQPAPERPTADAAVLPAPSVAPLPKAADAPDMPRLDTRLPAPPVPFAAPAPSALPTPRLPLAGDLTARPSPSRANAPARQRPPAPLAGLPSATDLPQMDTQPPAPRNAPKASVRPAPRPDHPAPETRPQQQPQTAQRPAQTARGTGQQDSTAQAPARAAPVVSGPSQAQLAQAQREWGAGITRALRRAHRPPRGSAAGTVALRIAISPSGHVQGVAVTASSGHAALDQAALAAVQRARFPRAPKSLTKAVYQFSQRLTVSR